MIANKNTLLLEAALTCFVERGFHATTTADVATRANVGNATLFRAFASKEALMEATHTYAVTQLASLLTDKERAARPNERLYDLLSRWWQHTTEAALVHSVAFRYWCLYRATPRLGAPETRSFEFGPFADVPALVERAVGQAPWLTTNALPIRMIVPLLVTQWTAVMEIVIAIASEQADVNLRAVLLSRAYIKWWGMIELPSHTLVADNIKPLATPAKPTPGIDAISAKYASRFKRDV